MNDAVTAPDPSELVSHEQGGRTLTGVGVTTEALAETMDRHTPVEEPPAAPADAQAHAPKPTRGQQRFSELTKRAKDFEAQNIELQRQLDALKAQIAAPSPAAPAASSPAPAPSSPSVPNGGNSGYSQPAYQPPPQGRPQPSEDEVGTKYKTYGEFVIDSGRWLTEQQQLDIDARIRQSIEADRASRDFMSQAERTWAKGREVYPDFDAVRMNGPGAHVPIPNDRVAAIIQHPDSAHIQNAIVRNADLAQQVASVHPLEFWRLLGSLAPAPAAVSQASTAAPPLPTLPAPIQPVGSGGQTTAPSLSDVADTGNFERYQQVRNEQRRRNRR